MVFSCLPFLFLFLPVVLLSNFLPNKAANFFLLTANLIFYAYGEPVYVFLMAGSILLNYFAGLLIHHFDSYSRKKAVLFVAILMNLGALGWFKYAGLFSRTLQSVFGEKRVPVIQVALPIGISFYTFQAMSYLIDVYRKKLPADKNLLNFATYISLFPQLIAGPIVRYSDVRERMENRKISATQFSWGVRMFCIGMAKKVLLANQFSILWAQVSEDPAQAGTMAAWVGILAFTLQLYFDFGGYSDMARGLGAMLGFDFCVNFNYPYISKSITEFWRRWHISLSTWFRDYVYIPLGGGRCSALRQCMNLMIVWMLTGIWHGAGWNFLLWGVYYGILLIVEKFFLGKLLKKIPGIVTMAMTFFLVMMGWVLFSAEDISGAMRYYRVLFGGYSGTVSGMYLLSWLPMLLIGLIAGTPFFTERWNKWQWNRMKCVLEAALCLTALIFSTASLVGGGYNPFLYFRF